MRFTLAAGVAVDYPVGWGNGQYAYAGGSGQVGSPYARVAVVSSHPAPENPHYWLVTVTNGSDHRQNLRLYVLCGDAPVAPTAP